jgi:protein-S-isoprenylcysteine O-methyltransferase Ste14
MSVASKNGRTPLRVYCYEGRSNQKIIIEDISIDSFKVAFLLHKHYQEIGKAQFLDENLLRLLLFLHMLLRHLVSIFALPVTAIIIVPSLLLSIFHFVILWSFQIYAEIVLFIAGVLFIGTGFIFLYSTITLFIKKGEGSIAPWNPTRKLIVTGFYSHVRNPMHIGVFLILTGESIMLGSLSQILWSLLFIICNLIYIPSVEEQKLAERFGDDYKIYRKNVPRWIPRLSSWDPNPQTLNKNNTA